MMKGSFHQSELLLETLTDSIPGMVGYWTKDLRSVLANRKYSNWFGKSTEEMKNIHIRDLLGKELFKKNEPHIRAVLAGEVQEFERALTKSDGERRDALVYYIPYRDGDEVLGFFTLILDITERKRLEQALISVAEERQHSMGQELHDSLGQQLAAMGYQSRALEKKLLASGDVESASIAASIAAQAHSAVMHCKQLAQSMLPFELEANGLVFALRAFSSGIVSRYGIVCDFVCPCEANVEDANVALNLYRIAQEAANNAIRHGNARHLVILLDLQENMLCLKVCDDGCGFVVDDVRGAPGMGIKIMRYRAKQIGARLGMVSRDEGGMEVRLEMRMK